MGRKRRVIVQANRNGFYYVLDRLTGEFIRGNAFVDKLTWATGLDPNGRPIRIPGMEPSPDGKLVCPTMWVRRTGWPTRTIRTPGCTT